MRRITGTVQELFAMLDPPATAITIAMGDAEVIVAVATGDLAVALRKLRCGTAIEAEIEDTHQAHTLIGYALSQSHGV